MKIGNDNKGKTLEIGDICSFQIDKVKYEGMIGYDEEYFSFVFEMIDDRFPCVLMSKVDYNSIEKIKNVWSTNVKDDKYKFYRELAKNN